MDDEGDRSAHRSAVPSLLDGYLVGQLAAGLTDVLSVRANRQVWQLSLLFPTERAAQPLLLLGCFGAAAQGRDAFVADRNASGSGHQALHLVLLLAAKGAHQLGLPLFIEDLDDVRPHLLQAEAKAFQHSCPYALALPEQSQEEVFGAEIGVVEAPRFIDGKLHHFLRSWGQAYFA